MRLSSNSLLHRTLTLALTLRTPSSHSVVADGAATYTHPAVSACKDGCEVITVSTERRLAAERHEKVKGRLLSRIRDYSENSARQLALDGEDGSNGADPHGRQLCTILCWNNCC